MNRNRKLLISCGVFVLLAALLAGIWFISRPAAIQGTKTVTVEVVHSDTSSRSFTYRTQREYLGELLLDEGLVEGEEGPYGLYITCVDGETADYSADGSYWAFFQGEEYAARGVSETVIADGDRFSLVYTVG